MCYLFLVIFSLWAASGTAQDWEDEQVFPEEQAARVLTVLSSTDTSFFASIIEGFIARNPSVQVRYLVTSTAEIDTVFRASPAAFDIVISSAMDLQIKLANDGLALEIEGLNYPNWAAWRRSLFAFTTEPAAIVINRAAFAGQSVPETRQDLIQVLRAQPEAFEDKLGTYDVRVSGVGYLFATQDARTSETYWRLMEVMGSLGTRLYCCSGDMIEDLAAGRITVAYNVLGSYAIARTDLADQIEVILPADFQTTMMRTALVSAQTGQPELATAFIRHLIDAQSNEDMFPLPPLQDAAKAGQPTITLEPALMTYLDALKKRTFLDEWVNAVIQ
ncbi:ABC transporter substrate-binding protein [Cognatishimia sp. MH4019]|uniref:ABC transporter substrate-binding protein n=1 Tax=Cognatishimia sp. MH4019 TaxID=2854030 RepID=UPI001CD23DDC|nr:extracellular solute-binding protein [Cognatishimia sp. MH4019]